MIHQTEPATSNRRLFRWLRNIRTYLRNGPSGHSPEGAFRTTILGQDLLYRSDRILCRLRNPEFDCRLCLYFDRLAGLRISPHARCALSLHELAEPRDGELAVLLRLLNGCLGQQIEEAPCLLRG